jgi:hypothetical protein
MKAQFFLALFIVAHCSVRSFSGLQRTVPYLSLLNKRWSSECSLAKLPALCSVAQENIQLKARVEELEGELHKTQKELAETLDDAAEVGMAMQFKCLEEKFERRLLAVKGSE